MKHPMATKVGHVLKLSLATLLGLPLIGVLALFWINRHDEALLPDLASVLDGDTLEEIAPQDNLFFTLIAFEASDGDGSNAEGQKIFARYLEAASQSSSGAPRQLYELSGTQKLSFAGSKKSLCPLMPDQLPYRCIGAVGDYGRDWSMLISDNQTLMTRYPRLFEADRYRNELRPDIFSNVMLDWSAVGDAKRLQLSQWAIEQADGDTDRVIEAVALDIGRWRHFISIKGLTLIDKLIGISQWRADLLLLSELIRLQTLTAAQYAAIGQVLAETTTAERSLASAMDNETRWQSSVIRKLGKTEASTASTTGRDRLFYLFNHAVFQPNATLNRLFTRNRALASIAEQPCASQTRSLDALEQSPRSMIGRLYNPIGNQMFDTGISNYRGYVGRVCNMDGIQRMIRAQIDIHRQHIADADVPAYLKRSSADLGDPMTGQALQWDANTRGLSFESGDEHTRTLMPWPI